MPTVFRGKRFLRGIASLLCLVMICLWAACKRHPSPVSSALRERAMGSDTSKKLQNCTKLLMDSLEKPTSPFHFSYKAQQNINSKYPMDKTAKPEVGPVELQADVSPEELDITETRGGKRSEHKAKKSDEAAWAFAQLDLLGPLTNTGFVLAFGQLVARPAGSDTVGGVATDKYDFDTSTATGSTKVSLDIAKGIITNIQSTKGTVWLDKSTGRLVKFNLDGDFADKAGHAWKEHYEGEVAPK